MVASGTGPLVFNDDVTADRSGRMTSEVYRAELCLDSAKCCKANRSVLHSANG